MSGALILKIVTLLVAAFGAICGIVMWFVPVFSLDGFTTGIVIIAFNLVFALAELKPSILVEKFLPFLLSPLGRALYLTFIGLIFAGTYGLWIACWVIFWLLAAIHYLIFFTGNTIIPNEFKTGFTEVPDGSAAQEQQQGISPDARFADSGAQNQ
jgi:hypothetical protein